MSQRLHLDEREASPLLVVGSVAFDNIITPYAKGERILGGSASFASLACSYFCPTQLVGIIGNDFDDIHIDRFRKQDIDLEGLQIDKTGPTFFWAGKYHENFNQRDTLETQLNVFENFRPDLPASYKQTPYVLLANIGPDLQHHVLDQMEAEAYVVADTMNLWINIMHDTLLDLMKRVHLLVVNDDESEMLTESNNIILAGEKLREMGPETVIIKKGSHGAVLFHEAGVFSIPAYPVTDLRDPTGAGDSFVGALAGYLAAVRRSDFAAIKQAMLYATVIGSFTVEAFSCDRLETAGVVGIEERRKTLLDIITP